MVDIIITGTPRTLLCSDLTFHASLIVILGAMDAHIWRIGCLSLAQSARNNTAARNGPKLIMLTVR